jgi:hypothetical protein
MEVRVQPPARIFALVMLAFIGATSAACLDRLIARQAPSPSVSSSGRTIQTVGIVAGAPITANSTSLRVPAGSDGQARTPVSAYGNLILLRVGTQAATASSSYELWDPANGAVTPVTTWPVAEAARERVAGASGDWLALIREQNSSSNSAAVVLRNLKTSEARVVGSSGSSTSPPRVAVAEGWIAWFDGSVNPAMIHVYDVAGSADRSFAARSRNLSNLAVGGGVVAWWQSFTNQAPQILVRDAVSSKFDSVPANSVTALALSGDGHTVAWIQSSGSSNPGLFVRDVSGGNGGRLLGGQSVGVALTSSGPFISWQPAFGQSSSAGIYNVQTHELRILQPAPGSSPRLARLLGRWFVWSESAAPSGGGNSQGSGCCYVLRLPG